MRVRFGIFGTFSRTLRPTVEVIAMKKPLVFLMVLLLLFSGMALAETETDALAQYALQSDVSVEMDLDGDGTAETLVFRSVADAENDAGYAEIQVTAAGGGVAVWTSETLFLPSAYACDLDGDGVVEIFVCGDWASADYATYCLHYADGALAELSFANASRGDDSEPYIGYGYGYIQSIGDNELVLCGSQDVLGTYFGTRTFALQDGRFEFADDGLWHFLMDEETWEYRSLTPTQNIAATFVEDGGQTESEIAAGTRFVITASDKTSVAWFQTEDGREGYFSIAPDEERGWGCTVNGVPESELFEMVPYAD